MHGRTMIDSGPGLRPGFTLVELLIVVVILGILAGLGAVRYNDLRERAHLATLHSDVSNLALHQELYHHAHERYAALAELVDFGESEGVEVTIGWLTANGFAATLVHAALPGVVCGYFTGPAPQGLAGPANMPGQITCE